MHIYIYNVYQLLNYSHSHSVQSLSLVYTLNLTLSTVITLSYFIRYHSTYVHLMFFIKHNITIILYIIIIIIIICNTINYTFVYEIYILCLPQQIDMMHRIDIMNEQLGYHLSSNIHLIIYIYRERMKIILLYIAI